MKHSTRIIFSAAVIGVLYGFIADNSYEDGRSAPTIVEGTSNLISGSGTSSLGSSNVEEKYTNQSQLYNSIVFSVQHHVEKGDLDKARILIRLINNDRDKYLIIRLLANQTLTAITPKQSFGLAARNDGIDPDRVKQGGLFGIVLLEELNEKDEVEYLPIYVEALKAVISLLIEGGQSDSAGQAVSMLDEIVTRVSSEVENVDETQPLITEEEYQFSFEFLRFFLDPFVYGVIFTIIAWVLNKLLSPIFESIGISIRDKLITKTREN